jgi:uncharacterized protein YecT (DUF1311 family)
MKSSFVITFILLLTLSALHAESPSPVVPKGWLEGGLRPELLAQVEDSLQSQLETGVAMNFTAWNMATVKDAQLLVVYLSLFEKLPEAGRKTLLKEQEDWLKRRQKASARADDGKSGSEGRLLAASEYQSWTEKRIAELKRRVAGR